MCGFLVFREHGDNSRIRLRGQDHTQQTAIGGFTFVHNLLHVTGRFTPQPFVDIEAGIVCLYNGEVYNQPFAGSDGECLIPLYKEHGPSFPCWLDGEFAVALYDFRNRVAVFATDPFGTKPLYVNGAECGSYRSGVGGDRLRANRVRTVRLPDGAVLDETEICLWDFGHQSIDVYDRWIEAFEAAVAKRATPGCFIGMSAGYDSGAIACAMLRKGVDFKAYSYRGKEDPGVLDARLAMVPERELFEPSRFVKRMLTSLYAGADNEKYTIHYDGVETTMRLLDDGGIYGVATYSMLARNEGRRVALSGQGADEILSDYSPFPKQSELRGVFPDRLRKWRNFDRGCQESYLLKEEYAGGAFSVETRYPFLDKAVVQEFLNLTPKAKNRRYKAPIHEYLTRCKFPFREGVKTGFAIEI